MRSRSRSGHDRRVLVRQLRFALVVLVVAALGTQLPTRGHSPREIAATPARCSTLAAATRQSRATVSPVRETSQRPSGRAPLVTGIHTVCVALSFAGQLSGLRERREAVSGSRRTVTEYDTASRKKDGLYEEYDAKTNVLLVTGTYASGQKVGLWTEFDKSGRKKFETPYADGRPHGVKRQFAARHASPGSTTVVDDVALVVETTFVAGKRHGVTREWLPDGTLQKEEEYSNGERHGPYKTCFLGGQVGTEGQYLFGQKHGVFRHYLPDGSLEKTVVYSAGSEAGGSPSRVLDTAIRHAHESFDGWSYGSTPQAKRVDCTGFLVDFLTQLEQGRLDKQGAAALRQKIHMVGLGGLSKSELRQHVLKRDLRTRGVVNALESLGLGVAIEPGDARPGDFVQYWNVTSRGVEGHAAIISSVKRTGGQLRADLFGVHESRDGAGFIDNVNLSESGERRFVYIGRLNE